MPSNNPILYSESSGDDINANPNATMLEPPKVGALTGFGEAFETTAVNSVKAAWQFGREVGERSLLGNEAFEAAGGVERVAPPPKMDKIDPLTTGVAAQVLAPLAFDIPASIATLGGATLLASSRERLTEYQTLREKGVDPQTAQTAANIKGVETMATFGITRIPFATAISKIGTPALRWGAKAAVGAATQFGMDFAGSETRAQILAAHGYDKAAEQLRHWDAMRIASDAVGGVMLGLTTRAPVDSEIQLSARALSEADQLQHESGPGLPTTPEMSGATTEATLKAANDLQNGQPANVGDVDDLFNGHFLMYQEKNIAEAQGYLKEHETVISHYDKQIGQVQKQIEKARSEGMDDIAQHLEEVELPQLQNVRRSSERLADQFRDDIARLKDPDGLTPAGRDAQPFLAAHAEEAADIKAKGETFALRDESSTPAAMAQQTEAPADVAAEAKQMLSDYRNPMQQAAAPAEKAPGEAAAPPAPKLTPEEQEMVDMHHELRALADVTGDAQLHADLDNAMRLHEAQHMEANKFNVAALCAIG